MRAVIAAGAVAIGAAVAFTCLPRASRGRFSEAMGRRIVKRMERLMASLPEEAPPRLIMSVLPRLREQNEVIIAMLREQNELLRKQLHTA